MQDAAETLDWAEFQTLLNAVSWHAHDAIPDEKERALAILAKLRRIENNVSANAVAMIPLMEDEYRNAKPTNQLALSMEG